MKSIKILGHGGFGNVDLVADSKGTQYARKTFAINQPLPPELAANVLKRFVREAKTQMSLSHRNIVPVLGGDLNCDPPYYLMAVAKGSLADDIAADRTLGGSFLSAVSDIVAGLEEIHNLQIYHRDLKPQNVLRFLDGDKEYYAISDFGLISQRDSRISALTTTGMIKGSDYYTAPEITSDLRKASRQSDIYSLGCILHDLVGTDDRIPCHEIREDGPYGAILLNCTRKDPARRFKSVSAVLDALVSIEPDSVVPPTAAANHFVTGLEGDEALGESFWRDLADFLEGRSGTADARAILMKLSQPRIDEVCTQFPSHATRLASSVARWVQESAFDFNSCDGIANRLEVFIQHCPFDVKAECLLAMLELGTSHNRWYVERKFMRLCGEDMDELFAKRMAIEFRVSKDEVCRSIRHLERSISATRDSLHSILAKTLHEICK